jgi:crotonobetainyl-CoA:carnitine CoA-transferase CaiB-like acyl-CoA transferase
LTRITRSKSDSSSSRKFGQGQVDMKTAEGLDLVKRMVATADILIDNIRYGDSTAGACAALACVAALHHRESTGEGRFIDLSAVEAMTGLVGDSLFAASVIGAVPEADGNFHPEMCPHSAYPCAEHGGTSIAVANEAEWQALCQVLQAPALAADERFADLADRLLNRLALDAAIGALTVSHDAARLAEKLRNAGVPAFKSMSSLDLVTDAFLWQRQAYRLVSDHRSGTHPIIGPSWRISPDPPLIERGAPLLGEHNGYG